MNKSDFYADALAGSRGPLAGVRVLEATNYGAGPICGMVLSDLGAESIKCEQPQTGDPIRSWPPYLTGADAADCWSGIWALSFNRGKRAVTLDLRKPEGQDLFRRLAAQADIVIENFTPGTMARWSLGYADLKAVKDDLIYVSVSGFGQWGPLRDKRGLDPIGQCMGGVMAATGEPGGRPLRVGFAIADNMSGWLGAMGALAALNFRRRTGRGQWVDSSLIDAMLTSSDVKLMGVANAGYEVNPTGNGTDLGAPLDLYRCADGRWLYIHALYDHLWKRLADVMGRPELKDDPRTRDWAGRAANIPFVNECVGAWAATLPLEQAMAALDAAGCTCAPVLSFPEILATAHFRERDSVVEMPHPRYGPLTHYGYPVKFSRTPAGPRAVAPAVGQDNAAVYGQLLGLSEAEQAALRAEGVI